MTAGTRVPGKTVPGGRPHGCSRPWMQSHSEEEEAQRRDRSSPFLHRWGDPAAGPLLLGGRDHSRPGRPPSRPGGPPAGLIFVHSRNY